MSKQFTVSEVAEHNTVEKGLYIIIDNSVYSVAEFKDEHPGGAKILTRVGGKDASKQYHKVTYIRTQEIPQLTASPYHNAGVIKKYGPKLKVGEVKESAKL